MARFNVKKYGALQFLEQGNLIGLHGYECDYANIALYWDDFEQEFKKIVAKAKSNICYIAPSFVEARRASGDKFIKTEFIDEIGAVSGVFIEGEFTYCYDINYAQNTREGVIIVFDNASIICLRQIHTDEKGNMVTNGFFSENYHSPITDLRYITAPVVLNLLFKKFAEVELVEVAGNSKVNSSIAEIGKVLNETNLKINILDSKWFREIHRNDPFFVNGHPRWQACGEGFKDRKLIWVSGFEKQGYHRKAGKDKVA